MLSMVREARGRWEWLRKRKSTLCALCTSIAVIILNLRHLASLRLRLQLKKWKKKQKRFPFVNAIKWKIFSQFFLICHHFHDESIIHRWLFSLPRKEKKNNFRVLFHVVFLCSFFFISLDFRNEFLTNDFLYTPILFGCFRHSDGSWFIDCFNEPKSANKLQPSVSSNCFFAMRQRGSD